jgi:hypothetical protein
MPCDLHSKLDCVIVVHEDFGNAEYIIQEGGVRNDHGENPEKNESNRLKYIEDKN